MNLYFNIGGVFNEALFVIIDDDHYTFEIFEMWETYESTKMYSDFCYDEYPRYKIFLKKL